MDGPMDRMDHLDGMDGMDDHMDGMDDGMDDGDTPPGPSSTTPGATSQGKQPAVWGSEPDLLSPSSADASGTQSQISKRRRGLGLVTPNACNQCRKKRVKCDGRKPCGRCRIQLNVTCVYELPVRQSKQDLRNEIETLRRRQRSSDSVLSALVRPELWEEVLRRLRNGDSVDEISDWLDKTGASAALPGSTPRPSLTSILPQPFSSHVPGSFPSNSASAAFPPFSPGGLSTATSGGGSGGTAGPEQPQTQAQVHPPPPQTQDSPWTSGAYSAPNQAASSHVAAAGTGAADSNSPSGSSESRYRGLDQILAPLSSDTQVPATHWTKVTDDEKLVQHLLALYFCWEYPTFASLSKEHFLMDFQSGYERYCSPILVNALLALGCRFSTQPNTRADPSNPYSSGDHFFKECQQLLHMEEDHHTFTTIQALGIMSIREASCGRDSESWYYAGQSIRLAIEMGLHQIRHDGGDDDEDIAVQSATFWGAFALDHAWSLATGSLPQCSFSPTLLPKPAIIDDIEASLWIPYTDGGTPLQRPCQQPSNVRSVYTCFCQLSELVHQSLYLLHTPGQPLVSRDLLNMYTQYLNWYGSIPEVLRLGHNFTPAVLFAHMYYHFAILLLFRPLIKLRIIGSMILPRDVCLQAADAIQNLLRSYSQLYTLQRTPSFVPYLVLTSSIMHLAIGASSPTATTPTAPLTTETAAGSHDAAETTVEVKTEMGMGRGTGPTMGPSMGPVVLDGDSADTKRMPAGLATGGAAPVAGASSDPRQRVVESINRGIADLTEMVPCHHFAEQALNILRFLAKKWNINVNVLAVTKGPGGRTGAEAGVSAGVSAGPANDYFDRSVRPLTSSLNFFAPNVCESDFSCAWGELGDVGEGTLRMVSTAGVAHSASLATASGYSIGDANVDNPLFWPFPMQGRPILASGQKLQEAGFALL